MWRSLPSEDGGDSLLGILWRDLADRWRGDRARANARLGFLKPPGTRGPLIWLRCGGDRYSVAYGAGLMAAVRDHRLDVRLVLTFDHEYPDLLETHLGNVQKRAGAGFGPASRAGALGRAVARLQPVATLCVGRTPERILGNVLEGRGSRLLVLGADPPTAMQATVEAAYPATRSQAARWEGRAGYVAPPSDPVSLLVQANARPTLRSLLRSREPLKVWWYHSDEPARLQHVAERFGSDALAGQSVLCLSGPELGSVGRFEAETQALSTWRREPVGAGTIMLVDDYRWLATLAASSDGVHLDTVDPEILWTALTGPGAISAGHPEAVRERLTRSESFAWLGTPPTLDALFGHWRQGAENRGEANRRALWAERRHASDIVQELLGRIYDW